MAEEQQQQQQEQPGIGERKAYMYHGLGCCFTGCDFDNIMLCSKADVEVCCVTHEHCLAANHDQLGIGLVSNDDTACCKIGCFCCTMGCKPPVVLCKGATQQWCLTQVMSFPFDKDYIEGPVCAFCFFQCQPESGCMLPYPETNAMVPILECTTPLGEVMTR